MDRAEAQRRDALLRSYTEGRDWDCVGERSLKREVVMNSLTLLPGYPYLVDEEWEVVPGASQLGVGDLVFTDGEGAFAVVEVKFVDVAASGKTARARRTKQRKRVREQAVVYRDAWASRTEGAVVAFTYTNEEGLRSLPA